MPYWHGMKWLKGFLKWLDDWESEVTRELTAQQQTKPCMMLLSRETLAGIRMTIHSFLKSVPYLFTIPGLRSFLSERISQDPLEKFFGRQRQRGGVNDNPNVAQFQKNNQALQVINSIDLDIVLGNTRGTNPCLQKENAEPLCKRHHHKGDADGSKDNKSSQEINIPCDPDSPLGMFVECMRAATQDKGFQLAAVISRSPDWPLHCLCCPEVGSHFTRLHCNTPQKLL